MLFLVAAGPVAFSGESLSRKSDHREADKPTTTEEEKPVREPMSFSGTPSQKSGLRPAVAFFLLLIAVTCGCASSSPTSHEYPANEPLRGFCYLPGPLVEKIYMIREKIMAAAAVKADFRISADPAPNAFFSMENNIPTITITSGVMRIIGDDADAYAFLIAHECAHLSRQHLKTRKEKRQGIRNIGSAILTGMEFVGMAIGVPLGFVSLFSVESGSHLAGLKYDRDQEREADRLAVEYMIRAGFDPAGAVRFQEKMITFTSKPALPIFSTHPPTSERVQYLKEMVNAHVTEDAPREIAPAPE